MNVEEISTSSAVIKLTEQEMRILFGSFKNIDYKNPACKYTIHKLLKNNLPKTFFPLNSKSVLIEIKPLGGGLSIKFTKLYEKSNGAVLIKLKNLEALIAVSHHLKKTQSKIKCSKLYGMGSIYYLRLNLLEERYNLNELYEFGEIVHSQEKTAAVYEYCNLICKNFAIEKITESFKET